MKKRLIHENYGEFAAKLVPPFNNEDLFVTGLKNRQRLSKYRMNRRSNALCYPVVAAVDDYAYMKCEQSTLRAEALGKREDELVCEWETDLEDTYRVFSVSVKADDDKPKGVVIRGSAVKKNGTSLESRPVIIGSGDGVYDTQGQEIIYCLMPELLKDKELRQAFNEYVGLRSHYSGSASETNQLIEVMSLMNENIIQRLTYGEGCENISPESGFDFQVDVGEELESFPNLNERIPVNLGTIPFKCLDGALPQLHTDSSSKNQEIMKKEWTLGELDGAFVRDSERTLTAEELADVEMIRKKLEGWYVVPKQVVKAALAAKATYDKKVQFQNFYFYGEAGGGKSSAAMAFAVALNIPYRSLTFSANTEIMDVIQAIAPETVDAEGKAHKVEELLKDFPESIEITVEPALAYRKVTGRENPDATPEDVMREIYEKIAEKMKADGQRFKYVDSPLAQAFRYGYLCELQEPNIVANPGVLVGVNALLDRTATMVCSSGEVVRRHKDFIAVDTTNRSYAACRDVNASHLSRFHMALKFDKPPRTDMIERIQANTGFDDINMLNKMLDCVDGMIETLRNTGDENFSCGMREICNWVTWYMICGDIKEAAMDTIIPLSTQNDAVIERLENCLFTIF